MIDEAVINNWYEEIQTGIEEEILNCGYTYRDIENAKDARLSHSLQQYRRRHRNHCPILKKVSWRHYFILSAIKPMTEKISRETF